MGNVDNCQVGLYLGDVTRVEQVLVANAEHQIEQCLQRGKSEAGMADYQTRRLEGWYHHQTLSMLAVWCLVGEAKRGKKHRASLTVPQVREVLSRILHRECGCGSDERIAGECTKRLERNELARMYLYEKRKLFAPLRSHPSK